MNIEILEEAAGIVAQNLFNLKYADKNISESAKELDECLNDTVFVINNFMRISADLVQKQLKEQESVDE